MTIPEIQEPVGRKAAPVCTLHVAKDDKVLLARLAGPALTPATLSAFDDAIRTFTAKWGVHRDLLDFSAVEDASDLPSKFIANRSQFEPVPHVRLVLVASKPAIFGLCRMYASYQRATSGEDPAVVSTMDQAYAALSLQPSTQWAEAEY
jgi:hypothetical protein